jgi:hypothetical protein
MICEHCATAADIRAPHDRCPGKTWCDCQHEVPPPPFRHANGVPCYGCQMCLFEEEETLRQSLLHLSVPVGQEGNE